MLNWKEVSDGHRSQNICDVGVPGDYTFAVGKAVVGPTAFITPTFTVTLHHPFE